jgi:hypothetical protein
MSILGDPQADKLKIISNIAVILNMELNNNVVVNPQLKNIQGIFNCIVV